VNVCVSGYAIVRYVLHACNRLVNQSFFIVTHYSELFSAGWFVLKLGFPLKCLQLLEG